LKAINIGLPAIQNKWSFPKKPASGCGFILGIRDIELKREPKKAPARALLKKPLSIG
jgi:hypothetical protein